MKHRSCIDGGEIYWIDRDSREWDAMWSALDLVDRQTGGPGLAGQENQGEIWQYMGTVANGQNPSMPPVRQLEGSEFVHEFRHRNHPITHNRKYFGIPASPGWQPILVDGEDEPESGRIVIEDGGAVGMGVTP